MKRDILILAVATGVAAIPAIAKLPPPTAEERAAMEQKRAQEAEQVQREKLALERVQQQVADRYRRESKNAAPVNTAARVDSGTLPKTARELPGDAGPQGGREPSAEAHSGMVR